MDSQTADVADIDISGCADLTDDERETLLETHPVLEREYILPTPMMKRAFAVIVERIWQRRTGACFFAAPRTGKTRCAMATKNLLQTHYPKLHVSLLSARRSIRATDTHMFRLILEAERHVLAGRANFDLLFDNAIADIQVKTRAKSGGQFVLLIDEMQLLNNCDLQHLVEVHNALEKVKIKMTTISFAQPEILHRRTALMASNDHQIIARFLSEPLHYNGCSTLADLQLILRSFDEGSEYPENSGWSYTRFFVPLAFNAGFRLNQYGVALWRELSLAAGAGADGTIPMEHTCLSIENLLLTLRIRDRPNLLLSDAEIKSAVASSQLQSFSSCQPERI